MHKALSKAVIAVVVVVGTALGAAQAESVNFSGVKADVDAGHFDAALRDLDTILVEHPDSAKAHYLYAQVLMHQKKGVDAVCGHVGAAIKADPTMSFAGNRQMFERMKDGCRSQLPADPVKQEFGTTSKSIITPWTDMMSALLVKALIFVIGAGLAIVLISFGVSYIADTIEQRRRKTEHPERVKQLIETRAALHLFAEELRKKKLDYELKGDEKVVSRIDSLSKTVLGYQEELKTFFDNGSDQDIDKTEMMVGKSKPWISACKSQLDGVLESRLQPARKTAYRRPSRYRSEATATAAQPVAQPQTVVVHETRGSSLTDMAMGALLYSSLANAGEHRSHEHTDSTDRDDSSFGGRDSDSSSSIFGFGGSDSGSSSSFDFGSSDSGSSSSFDFGSSDSGSSSSFDFGGSDNNSGF